MRKQKIAMTLLMLAMLLPAAGCFLAVAAGGAAGTVAYVKGDFEAVEEGTVAEIYDAAVKALEDLKIAVISKQQDALVAQVEGRNAEDKKVSVKIEAQDEGLCKLSIRIGTFGDQTQSRMIYEKIKEYR